MSDLQSKTDEELKIHLALLDGWTMRSPENKREKRGYLVSPDLKRTTTIWKDGTTGGYRLPPLAEFVANVREKWKSEWVSILHELAKSCNVGPITDGERRVWLIATASAREWAIALIQALQKL